MTKDVIAVIGASTNPQKYGHLLFRDLLRAQYNVVPIHPTETEIVGQVVYPSVLKMPVPPTIVITVVPPAVTEVVVKEMLAAALPIKEIWMQPGSESQNAVQAIKQVSNKIVIHQACFMKAEGLW